MAHLHRSALARSFPSRKRDPAVGSPRHFTGLRRWLEAVDNRRRTSYAHTTSALVMPSVNVRPRNGAENPEKPAIERIRASSNRAYH
jgi:hypothetical protein